MLNICSFLMEILIKYFFLSCWINVRIIIVIGIGDIECLYEGCINILEILDFDIFLYIL